jgi:hypothetical protein
MKRAFDQPTYVRLTANHYTNWILRPATPADQEVRRDGIIYQHGRQETPMDGRLFLAGRPW